MSTPDKGKFYRNIEFDWNNLWDVKYRHLVTMSGKKEKPDILFWNIPPSVACDSFDLPKVINPKQLIPINDPVSLGFAQLATAVEKTGDMSVGIVYAGYYQVFMGDFADFINPEEAAHLILSSEARTVGLSIQGVSDLIYAYLLIKNTRNLAKVRKKFIPTFIAGGPQVSHDLNYTASMLRLPSENLFQGKAVGELLTYLGQVDKTHLAEDIDLTGYVVNPSFLHVPGVEVQDTPVKINTISFGGKACIGDAPCAYCTAYHLGEKVILSSDLIREQLESLAQAGFKKLQAGDNMINLVDLNERTKFINLLITINKLGMRLTSFLTRPDILANTPQSVLDQLKTLGIEEIFMGVESGDPKTLLAMGRIKGGDQAASEYLNKAESACDKLLVSGIEPDISSMICYPLSGGDGLEDERTLDFLAKLFAKGNMSLEINPVWPYPGSRLYAELIERGASHHDVLKYIIKAEISWDDFTNSILKLSGDIYLFNLLITSNKLIREHTVEYCNKQRALLNNMLRDKY